MKGRGNRERSDCGEVKEGEEEGRGGEGRDRSNGRVGVIITRLFGVSRRVCCSI